MLRCLSTELCLADVVASGIAGLLALNFAQPPVERTTLYEAQVREIRVVSDIAVSVMEHFHAAYDLGEMTLEEAQEQARDVVRDLRFGDGGYFFAFDYDGIAVIHGVAPEYEGTSLMDTVDPNGVFLVRELIDEAMRGGGVVRYDRPGPQSGTPVPRIAYAAPFEPWGWLVGTGVHMDDPGVTFWDRALQAVLYRY